ncbi:MAG: MFS transporter [Gammaproteobacteria bacterium]|nr:MFS transporter [Gammaproteobacteria bacterium]
MNNQAAVSHPPQYPPPSRAWLLVTLLTIAYVVSFVDRYILSLLIDPIKADLGLSDFQIGILLGPAFGIFYATIGLPLGYLADRTRRTWIVAAGVSIWTMATALSGLARNFAQMLVARVSVGIGEAALSPCAMSLIADSFPEERRGKPIAMYSSALSVGAALAALLGSAVLFWTNSAGNITLPLVGELTPWRIAFLIAGLPGLLLAVPFLLMREPPRITAPTGAGRQNLGDMFRHVGRHALTYGCFVSVFCYMTIVAYSQGWLAVMFDRTFGWPVEVFALYDGLLLIVIGPVSVMFAGWLSDRQTIRGQRDAPMRIAILGLFLSVPMAVIGPLLGNDIAAFIVVSASTIGGAFISSVGVTALLKIVPVGIRAQTIALYYMAISLAGLFLGPSLVGLLNDQVFGTDGVRYSVAVIPLIFGLPALLLSPLTLKLYRRALDNPEFSG